MTESLRYRTAGALLRRGAHRFRWELYQARVSAKRLALDAVCPPQRQAELLVRSAPRDSKSRPETEPSAELTAFRVPAPAAIEPSFGYIVHRRLGVIEMSLSHAECVRQRSKRQYFAGVPRLDHLFRRTGTTLEFDNPVSIRHPFESNYYHAIIDCMGWIAVAVESGLLDRGPLVVGPGLAASPFFRSLIESPTYESPPFVVQQPDTWINGRVGVSFVRPPMTCNSLQRTLRFLERYAPELDRAPEVKLYVTRESGDGRTLRNDAELKSAMSSRGYIVIDPGSLPWIEQVAIFRRATHVVGVHGAALTNILFRAPMNLSLLEIQSPAGDPPMFSHIARELGYDYRAIRGINPSDRGNRPVFDADVQHIMRVLSQHDA